MTTPETPTLDPRLYDRQLRVWGVAAQKKLSTSRVLVCGALNGLAAELTKDLVLAGIAALYLEDRHADVPLSAADLTANCLVGPSKIGTSVSIRCRVSRCISTDLGTASASLYRALEGNEPPR